MLIGKYTPTLFNSMSHCFKDNFSVLITMEPTNNTVINFEMILPLFVGSSNGIENGMLSLALLQADPGCDSDGGTGFSLEGVPFEVDTRVPKPSSLTARVVVIRVFQNLTSRVHGTWVLVTRFVGDDFWFVDLFEIVVNNQTLWNY